MQKKIISFSILLLLSISLTSCSPFKNNSNEKPSLDNSTTKPLKEPIKDSNPQIKDNFSTIETSNLDNTTISWFFIPNDRHITPNVNDKLNFNLKDYHAIYNGPTKTDSKTLYLTFDEGYENGYTPKILDTLKEKNVKAVFFVTSHYIKSNPDIIKRMADEGHIVGNHTNTHPSMPDKTSNISTFNDELIDVENKYKELTNNDMLKFFRPPMGNYSEKSLAMTNNLGYTSVFWSFAYHDWDTDNQPTKEDAMKKIMDNLHDGSILLLHAVSKTNTDILGDFIDNAQSQGYEFQLINQ
ncbi:MAG: delta-lactam-biosynthetic de-N-acetylase [Romboutsia sp.]